MPWDAKSFKKHNRKLSPGQSGKAASVANAILKRTGDEGLAIATANARAKGQKPKRHAEPFGLSKGPGG
jgi:uncharacterized protein YdaT